MENKKHKINIFDIVVVIVVAVIAIAGYKYLHREKIAETKTIRYTFEMIDNYEGFSDLIHVGDDITDNVKKITCPTLIIWGENDTTVDKENAYELEKLIKDSGVVILPGTHYAYLERIDYVTNVLINFIGGRKWY